MSTKSNIRHGYYKKDDGSEICNRCWVYYPNGMIRHYVDHWDEKDVYYTMEFYPNAALHWLIVKDRRDIDFDYSDDEGGPLDPAKPYRAWEHDLDGNRINECVLSLKEVWDRFDKSKINPVTEQPTLAPLPEFGTRMSYHAYYVITDYHNAILYAKGQRLLEYEEKYENDGKVIVVKRYPSGNKHVQYDYHADKDKPHGKIITWNEDGSLKSEYNYFNGKFSHSCYDYHEDGSKTLSNYTKDGLYDRWEFYPSVGDNVAERHWLITRIVETKEPFELYDAHEYPNEGINIFPVRHIILDLSDVIQRKYMNM
jgi:hypothetical protein